MGSPSTERDRGNAHWMSEFAVEFQIGNMVCPWCRVRVRFGKAAAVVSRRVGVLLTPC